MPSKLEAHQVVVLAIALRAGLSIFGVFQDAYSAVKYTDIDYAVFSDAAALVSQGQSPFLRATYRYTPLLAWLLARINGKLLFCACDLGAALAIHAINRIQSTDGDVSERASLSETESEKGSLRRSSSPRARDSHVWTKSRENSQSEATLQSNNVDQRRRSGHNLALEAGLWALNPFVAVISTRGNAESIIAALVLATVYLLMRKRVGIAALAFGLAVHLKVYAVIYAVPFWFFIDHRTPLTISKRSETRKTGPPRKRSRSKSKSRKRSRRSRAASASKESDGVDNPNPEPNPDTTLRGWLRSFFSINRLKFGIISAAVFLSFGALFYNLYGHDFLEHTYLYHITRQDHRHNFSVYFYHLYLDSNALHNSRMSGLLAFLPQLGVSTFAGAVPAMKGDIAFALFAQTFVFVMLNKVVTSQYFMWYLCFLPIILQRSELISSQWRKGLILLGMWIFGQALWLFNAYCLEHLGQNTFRALHVSGIIFEIVNAYVLVQTMRWHGGLKVKVE
ncbi:PIG-M-domain-containing protein [Chytriomyces sp. MP71]|nr:PIG-M-domain-containing protein [Chytriomyces sp. MP71]